MALNFYLVHLQIMVKKNAKDTFWHRIICLDFINRKLWEKNEARAYIINADETMLKCYQVFAERKKSFAPEPQLSDFYHPSKGQKMVNYYLW